MTLFAVSVDGTVIKTLYSNSVDATGGWFTTAAGAPANAPFNLPFFILMCVEGVVES